MKVKDWIKELQKIDPEKELYYHLIKDNDKSKVLGDWTCDDPKCDCHKD